ncbi:MAG: IclR family transcriptional regulator [Negativicutes bacterium]|nr:IclR family transcriptional regulator [Negativicutes bacterium]
MDKLEGPIQSVARAITIMEALLREPELGVSELGVVLGLGKSTVYRLLSTMKVHGLVDQTPSGKYRLGIRLSIYGDTAVSRIDLRKEAAPFLAKLAKISGENVSLAILDDFQVLYIDRIDSSEPLRMRRTIGERSPVFCVSLGKAILANLPGKKLEKIFADPRIQTMMAAYTEKTITDLGALRLELERIKQLGYAVDDEEYCRGVRCIGAPVFNHLGMVVAAVSTSGPSIRMTDDKITQLIPHVKEVAQEISRHIGYRTS